MMPDRPGKNSQPINQTFRLQISLKTWLALLVLGVVFWVITANFQVLTEILLILFITWLFVLAIQPVIKFFGRWHIPRLVSVLVVYLSLFGLIVLITNLLAPAFTTEINRFQTQGPQLVQQALTQIKNIPVPQQWSASVDKIAPSLTQGLDTMFASLFTALTGLGKIAIDIVVVLVLTLFISVDERLSLVRFIETWIPSKYQDTLINLHQQITSQLTRWFWAQMVIALYFAVSFSLGLILLKVPFAISIGLTGGVLEIVPYLGGIVAASLAMLSALLVSPLTALWVLILYFVVIEVESHLIAPLFYGRAVGIHPVVVLIALFLGVKAAGIVGVLLAVPTAVIVVTLMQEVRAHFISPGDEMVNANGHSG
jgi:predicted PurR-regulated permease PerM